MLASFLVVHSRECIQADHLRDRFEGSLPIPDKKDILKNLQSMVTTATPPEITAKILEDYQRHTRNLPKDTFLCCWHASNCESGAMWSIYGEGRRSVAVQSTFAKLHETESMFAGKQYGAVSFLFKRKSFEYEHELRCIRQRIRFEPHDSQFGWDDAESGREVPVPLDNVIERVCVSPESAKWFFELVKELTERLGHHFIVVQSGIRADPVF